MVLSSFSGVATIFLLQSVLDPLAKLNCFMQPKAIHFSKLSVRIALESVVSYISADVDIIKNACAMESIVDELLLEIGDAFQLHKQQQEARTNTCTSILVHGKTRFALSKTEKEVVEARKISVLKKTQTDTKYCMFIFNNIHELFLVFMYMYRLALATHVIIMSCMYDHIETHNVVTMV